ACGTLHAKQDASYRTLGRTLKSADGAITIGWPASGVEAKFRGTKVTARIEDEGRDVLDVTLDGTPTILRLDPGVKDYTLFSSDAPETHRIRLPRRSEIFSGLTKIERFQTEGTWLRLAPHRHRILVVGDSISVGYGIEGADQTCHYSAITSAPWRAYTGLTATA